MDALRQTFDLTVLTPKSDPPPDWAAWDGVRHQTFSRPAAPWRALRGLGAVLRGLPAQCGLYHFPDLARRLRHLAPEQDAAVLLLVRLALHGKDLGSTPWISDLVDSLSLSFSRRADCDHSALRPLWSTEAKLLRRAEARLAALARRTLVVSERDAHALRQHLGPIGSRIDVVPVAPPRREHPVGAIDPRPPTVAFTGNLGYFVNRDAMIHWLERVWPHLRRERPDLRLLVAGDRPGPDLTRRVREVGGELVARPADLQRLLASCSVAIAPMRAGAGMPLKVLDAWSVGVPVVASQWAAAGVAGTTGHDLLVAESTDDWCRAIGTLLDDAPRRTEITNNARSSLQRRFGREVVFQQLRHQIERVLAEGPIRSSEAAAPSG